MTRQAKKGLLPLFALVFLAGCFGGGSEGTGLGDHLSAYGDTPPVFNAPADFDTPPSDDATPGDRPSSLLPLEALDSCVPQFAEQSLLCGSVTADDGITPVAGVEVFLDLDIDADPILTRGNQCLTDVQGEYACILPSDISGIQTIFLHPPNDTGFDSASFQVDIQAGKTTIFQPQLFLYEQLEPIGGRESGVQTEPPLLVAVFSQSLERVQELLAQGENPNIGRSGDGATPLIAAAQLGYLDIANVLIEGGANPNYGFTFTPLMVASQNGHLDIVTLLLENGASVFVATGSNWTALHSAVSNDRENVSAVLIGAGAPLDIQVRGLTPLALAAQSGYTVVIDMLLNAGANPLGTPNNGPSPLTLAAQNGHSQAVERLIVGGAEPDNGGIGDAPFVTAAASGSTSVLEVLVLGGATLDIRSSRNNWTGLMWAANNNDIETASELLRLGADRTLRDAFGRTARDIAEDLGHTEVANLFP